MQQLKDQRDTGSAKDRATEWLEDLQFSPPASCEQVLSLLADHRDLVARDIVTMPRSEDGEQAADRSSESEGEGDDVPRLVDRPTASSSVTSHIAPAIYEEQQPVKQRFEIWELDTIPFKWKIPTTGTRTKGWGLDVSDNGLTVSHSAIPSKRGRSMIGDKSFVEGHQRWHILVDGLRVRESTGIALGVTTVTPTTNATSYHNTSEGFYGLSSGGSLYYLEVVLSLWSVGKTAM